MDRLSVLDTVSQAGRIIAAWWPVFLGLALLAHVPSLVAEIGFVDMATPPDEDGHPVGENDVEGVPPDGGILFLIAISSFLLQGLANAALVHATGQVLQGTPPGFVSSVTAAFRRLLPVIGVTLLHALILLGAAFAVVLPGLVSGAEALTGLLSIAAAGLILFLYLVFFVAIPACMVEGTGPVASLNRSVMLTRGQRGPLLGVIATIAVAFLAALAVAEGASTVLGTVATTILRYGVIAAAGAFSGALSAIVYGELHRLTRHT